MHPLAQLDHNYVWHPFTQMRDWLQHEPILISSGKGAVLRDIHGRQYLDANASIWTNLHGHNHPKLNRAIVRQLRKIAHSSALGLANEPASLLAEKLVLTANPANKPPLQPRLSKVFFSDDGSTAIEVALKLAYETARRTGRSRTPRFLSMQGAYHGDTVGAVSLGHIDLFHKAYGKLLFKSDHVMSPYCYRCPHNLSRPERADAREYRKCQWECISSVEQKFTARHRKENPYAAMVVEPLMQGAAGMIAQPKGWLKHVDEIVRRHGAQLIADEVMTGFGRAGTTPTHPSGRSSLFASHLEGVQPDFLALAKGLTGGYLPMAATMTTQETFDAFLGDYTEFKTFFHGHSYTGNQLGSAAALASLDVLQSGDSIQNRARLERTMREQLKALWQLERVGDVRQVGLVAGIELVRRWQTREPFDPGERAGMRVCEAMTKRGVLTRPIGNVIVLMPPYCTTDRQLAKIIAALKDSIAEVLGE